MARVIVFSLFVLAVLVMTSIVSAYPSYMYKENYNGRVFYTQADTGMMFGSNTFRTMYRETPQIMMKNRAYFFDNTNYPRYAMNRRSGKVYYIQRI